MKIVECVQGTEDWARARAGIPTASEWDNLISPTGKIRAGEMPRTYFARKLAERWINGPLPSTYGGGGMEQGHLKEAGAIGDLTARTGRKIHPVGLILTDDETLGCSPDGMFDDGDGGAEIKSPDLHTQIKYLLGGVVPPEYVAQVQGSMLVAEAARWVFFSYCPPLPPLTVTVGRDQAFCDALEKTLDDFLERLDAGMAHLCALNGGQRPTAKRPASDGDDDGNTLDIL